jgi:hypothetical protein
MAIYLYHFYANIRTLTSVLIGIAMIWASIAAIQINAVQAIEEQNIPLAKCIYDGQEYFMKAHIVNDLNFPNLPDNNVPQMIVEKGQTLTMTVISQLN